MNAPVIDDRVSERPLRDEAVAAEPLLAPAELTSGGAAIPLEVHLARRHSARVARMIQCEVACQLGVSANLQGSSNLPMTVREAITRIEADGGRLVNQKGSHRQFKHAVTTGRVTIAGVLADDLHPKTWKSISVKPVSKKTELCDYLEVSTVA